MTNVYQSLARFDGHVKNLEDRPWVRGCKRLSLMERTTANIASLVAVFYFIPFILFLPRRQDIVRGQERVFRWFRKMYQRKLQEHRR